MKKTILVSGSFDPLHIGHIAYLKAAKKLGDFLVVAIKGNNRLKSKKNRHFMDEEERKNILESLKYIDKVFVVDAPNDGMIASLSIPFVQPYIYATGEDSVNNVTKLVCHDYGVKIKYRVGGKRIRSSSQLLKDYYQTPWEE